MTLIFATANKNKIAEIQGMVPKWVTILGLEDVGITEDIPENEPTLEGNALSKARYVYQRTGKTCFADDTGLEVAALNGEPGVYSARYSGPDKDPERNMDLVLEKLQDKKDRTARFRTVIALVGPQGEMTFEGRVEGVITSDKKGNQGFGYDPIFIPEDRGRTFAEMSMEEKNQLSHRGRAFGSFINFLEGQS